MNRAREMHFYKDLTEIYLISNYFSIYDAFIDRSSAGKENVQDFQMCFHDSAKVIQLNPTCHWGSALVRVPVLLSGLIF